MDSESRARLAVPCDPGIDGNAGAKAGIPRCPTAANQWCPGGDAGNLIPACCWRGFLESAARHSRHQGLPLIPSTPSHDTRTRRTQRRQAPASYARFSSGLRVTSGLPVPRPGSVVSGSIWLPCDAAKRGIVSLVAAPRSVRPRAPGNEGWSPGQQTSRAPPLH